MSHNLSNAYTLSQDLKESAQKLAAHQNDLNGIKTSQTIFTIATYFIYFSFTSVIFAGVTVWNLQDYIFGNYTNVIGMTWALVTVFMVPLALSLAKYYNYKAIAKNSVERGGRSVVVVRSIIALALLSGLYYEAISSSSNLQAKAFHSVEHSKAGQSIMNTAVSSSASGLIADKLADAEFKLVSCQRRLKEGSVKDCNNSQAKVNSLKQQAQAERDTVASANVAAIAAKQDALAKERADHALPAAKYVAEMAGRSNDYGTMVVVIIAALFFELIHITTIFNESRALRGIDDQTASVKRLNGDYFKETGKTFDTSDFTDNRKIDLSDAPLNLPMGNIPTTASLSPAPLFKHQQRQSQADTPLQALKDELRGMMEQAPARIAREFAQAQQAREQLYQKAADKLAAMDKTVSSQPAPANLRESGGFRQSPEQLARVYDLAADTSGELYRNTLRNGSREFHDQPLDAPVNRPAPAVPNGYTYSPDDTHCNGYTHSENMLDDRLQKVADDLYPEWVAAVKGGNMTHAKDPCQKFIWKRSVSEDGKTVISAPETLRIWNIWKIRAASESVLLKNPKYTGKPPHPEYILNPAFKQAA